MSRVLLAWELGGNYGHVSALRGVAQALRDAGHQCLFAVQELASAERLGLHALGPVVQAPRASVGARAVAVQTSYASLLHNNGFDDAIALAARLRAWQTLMQTAAIDAVAVNHAPTALSAAQALGLPRSSFGSSFCCPPAVRPFPWFQPARKEQAGVLERNEARVLETLNRARERLQQPPLPTLQALFADCPQSVLSFAELDTYGPDRAADCLGHPDYSHGDRAAWPAHAGPRVFGYLRSGPWLPPLLEALRDSRVCALLHVPGVPPAMLARHARPGLAFTEGAVHLREVAAQCDALIHAGQDGTSSEALLSGRPALALPTDVEKLLVTQRLLALGAAVMPARRDQASVAAALRRVIDDAALRQRAEAFARNHQRLDRPAILRRAAQRLTAQL